MTQTKHPMIAIIGAGNMGSCLVGGLIANHYSPDTLWISDPSTEKLHALKKQFNINMTSNNEEAVQTADVIVLAVKPNYIEKVAAQLATFIQTRQVLILSIAAGIREINLRKWLGEQTAIVRVMPNTPALIGCGASGLFANSQVSSAQHALAESIMRAVGLVVWVDDEKQMDIITALSGSGPAYFFLIMEILQKAAEELGLPGSIARLLTLQTAYGAARMALESDQTTTVLRQQVTSPGGTTERGIQTLEIGNLRQLLTNALQAAKNRSEELGGINK